MLLYKNTRKDCLEGYIKYGNTIKRYKDGLKKHGHFVFAVKKVNIIGFTIFLKVCLQFVKIYNNISIETCLVFIKQNWWKLFLIYFSFYRSFKMNYYTLIKCKWNIQHHQAPFIPYCAKRQKAFSGSLILSSCCKSRNLSRSCEVLNPS